MGTHECHLSPVQLSAMDPTEHDQPHPCTHYDESQYPRVHPSAHRTSGVSTNADVDPAGSCSHLRSHVSIYDTAVYSRT
ncbi:hypothetical protein P691DRAFT_298405 [Macrolepiota fuliginosa MF-IS2]|uniref:Uncharacterized protein n=1 Tax=Macrolepiota fuliginosa MF-IS2 TaxID=1400762 RepID=A0A9P5WXN5_9AGAR|nr:hypothetical protein P691DRAFT_298405 [Macrolepiota fuliginosa MF-IS2]